MLPFYRTPNMSGFCYKNLTFAAFKDVLKYNISSIYDLGLPKNALVFGIGWRMPDNRNILGQAASYSKRGVELVENVPMQSATITLKDSNTRDILSKHPILPTKFNKVDEFALGSQSLFFEPRLVDEIDFTRSTITFLTSPVPNAGESRDIELIMYYYDQNCAIEREPSIILNSGVDLTGIRTMALDLVQEQGTREYGLARASTIGINRKSILVGMYFQYAGKVTIAEGPPAENMNQTFLTLKRRQNTFVDELPIQFAQSEHTNLQLSFQQDFTPIQPTKIGDIDWEASQIKLADGKFGITGNTVRLVLAYIDDHTGFGK